MSERGVFAVDRGIWDHPALAGNNPFSAREAWIWLLSEAAWKPHRKRVGSATVELERGQLAHSYRFLAERWQWSLGKVQRFLRRLETDTMVKTASDTGTLILTICNYGKYQRVSLPDEAPPNTAPDTAAIHDRYKLEDKENKEISSETTSLRIERASARPSKASGRRDLILEELCRVVSQNRAEAILESRQKHPLTVYGAQMLAKKLAQAPNPNEAADLMIERGWRGFDIKWMERDQAPRRKSYGDIIREAEAAEAARIARHQQPPTDPELSIFRHGQWVDAGSTSEVAQ